MIGRCVRVNDHSMAYIYRYVDILHSANTIIIMQGIQLSD